jgi:hypothetical protein
VQTTFGCPCGLTSRSARDCRTGTYNYPTKISITSPGEADLFEHPLRHFGGEHAILRGGLHQRIQRAIADDRMVLDVRLAGEVERGVIEVFAGERRHINRRPAGVVAIYAMLFHQLHASPRPL